MVSRRLLLLIAPLALGSCSQHTELSARFIDGQVAFVALHGQQVDCVHYFYVMDVVSRETMWEIGEGGRAGCPAALPIRYGQAVAAVRHAAKPLRLVRRYEVGGAASGGNSLDGRFMLNSGTALRLTDLPWDAAIDEPILNASENSLQ